MTDRLSVYNDALVLCGERMLASLTEDREGRRLLDHYWNNNEVYECLESGQWKFALRAQRLDYDPSITPLFGYHRGFVKPTDWVATAAVCEDEFYNAPLTRYSDEAGYWYADIDQLYIKFVSNDPGFGMNLAKWTQKFSCYVAAHLAGKIVHKLTADKERWTLVLNEEKRALLEAKNHDAMSDPTKFPAQGSWSRSRQGRSPSRRDRGNRGQLIG